MTTHVKVTACCAPEKQVELTVVSTAANDQLPVEAHILQNGESRDVYVYDDRVASVREVLKP